MAKQGSGAGSESGASVVESIGVERSMSKILPEKAHFGSAAAATASASSAAASAAADESEFESMNAKLHALRLMILDQLLAYTPRIREAIVVQLVRSILVHSRIGIQSWSVTAPSFFVVVAC